MEILNASYKRETEAYEERRKVQARLAEQKTVAGVRSICVDPREITKIAPEE